MQYAVIIRTPGISVLRKAARMEIWAVIAKTIIGMLGGINKASMDEAATRPVEYPLS